MRLLLPSLCLLSSTFGTRAKVVVADGTKQVDDNRLQDNVAVAPGPLQPVSRGLRRGGNGGKLTPIKLDESNAQELVDSGTDDLASEDMFYAMELSAKSVKSAKGHHKTKSAKGHHKTKSAKTMPTSTPPTPESGRSGASGASEVDDYYYYGGYYYYDDDGRSGRSGASEQEPNMSPTPAPSTTSTRPTPETGGIIESPAPTTTSTTSTRPTPETGGIESCTASGIECGYISFPDNTRTGCFSDPSICCSGNVDNYRHDSGGTEYFRCAPMCVMDNSCVCDRPIDDDNNPPPKKNACLANEPEASAQEAECKNQYPGRYEKCSDLCGYAKCLRPLTACTEEMEDFLSCHMQWGACSCDDNGTSGAFGASEVDDYYYYEGYYYYDDDGKSDLPDKDDGDGESDEPIGVSEQDPISPTPETTTPSTSPMGYGSTTRSKVSELDVVELDANVSKRGKSAKLNLFG